MGFCFLSLKDKAVRLLAIVLLLPAKPVKKPKTNNWLKTSLVKYSDSDAD